MYKGKVFITGAVRIFLQKRSNKSKGRKNVWHGNWHVWNAKCKCLPYCCYMTNLEICGLPHTVEICDCLFSSNATTAADDMKNLHKTPLGWTSQPNLVIKCSATCFIDEKETFLTTRNKIVWSRIILCKNRKTFEPKVLHSVDLKQLSTLQMFAGLFEEKLSLMPCLRTLSNVLFFKCTVF